MSLPVRPTPTPQPAAATGLHAFFSKIRIFSRLTPEELNDLLRAIQPFALAPGQVLFEQGAAGDAAYVVERGTLEVSVDQGGAPVIVARLTAGEVIGELALLDGETRSATVRAVDACSLYRLDRGEFDFLRRNLRPAAYKLIREIASAVGERIRETNDQIMARLDEQRQTVAGAQQSPPTGKAKGNLGAASTPTPAPRGGGPGRRTGAEADATPKPGWIERILTPWRQG